MPTGPEHPNPLPAAGGPQEVENRPAPVPSPAEAISNLVQSAVPNGSADPSDESPTIISKLPRRPARPEEAITGALRGRRLAHFELRDAIGVGGMAAVIRAQDTKLERTVALKILPPEMAADPENIRRFHQEARAAASLDHENIARVFYCGDDQGLHFIAFEYVEGENLRTILERRGRLSVSEAIHYMLQIATGLAHAAARGVVHRDIKPSNIIITPTGRAKLVDMGLARSLERRSDGGLTQSGVMLGTFDYVSPEQALEPREADVRSDIYSLGCTFYHMLTGQTPVPEGNPAKKLHHHQYVAPIDPRQLNPEIPDEVAAILAKMMAKDPADRYQRPEHLVAHLIQIAQKLGTGSEVPEALLFVDAPLLSPPRIPPVVVGLMASAAVVGLVILFTWMGGSGAQHGPDKAETRRADGPGPPEDKDPFPVPKPGDPQIPSQTKGGSVVVRDAGEFAEALKKPGDVKVSLNPANDFLELKRDAKSTDIPGLVFEGGKLYLASNDYGTPATVFLAYDAGPKGPEPWAILTIAGEGNVDVEIHALRFWLDARQSNTPIAAVLVRKKGGTVRVTFEDCEFIQGGWPESVSQRRLSAVLVDSSGSQGTPTIEFRKCCFRSGHDAVTAKGPARIIATDCAFGPHDALFRLRGTRRTPDSTAVTLRNCSALLRSGAAFELEDGVSARLSVSNSIFSAPNGKNGDSPVLIRQTGDGSGFYYNYNDGRSDPSNRNVYHNLAAYVAKFATASASTASARVPTLAAFRQEPRVGESDASLELDKKSPWRNPDPLTLLEPPRPGALNVRSPKDAFLLDVTEPRVRQVPNADDPEKIVGVVGVEDCIWGRLYDPDDLRGFKPPVASKTKIVDPTLTKTIEGRYPSLAQALGDAQPGDEILIEHNGAVSVEPVRLEKAADVTIKPHPNCRPVLILKDARDKNSFFFRIYDGKLKLKQLEFRLQPSREAYTSQTVAEIVGDGQVMFEDCLITQEETVKTPCAAVTVTELQDVMPMGTPRQREPPKIRFENCFVRGRGDGIWVRVSRQINVEVEKSLFALDGSFLTIEGAKDVRLQSVSTVSLKETTTYLTDHLLLLGPSRDDPKKKALVTTAISAANCLFVPAGKKSLVRLDGFEAKDDPTLQGFFSWEPQRSNAYGSFPQFIDQQGTDPIMPPSPHDRIKWKRFAGDDNSRFLDNVPFVKAPPVEGMVNVLPKDFQLKLDRVQDDLLRFGANIKLREPAKRSDESGDRE